MGGHPPDSPRRTGAEAHCVIAESDGRRGAGEGIIMQRRIMIAICLFIGVLCVLALFAPRNEPRSIFVSPLVLQSPMITITIVDRAHLPLVICDDCVTPRPTLGPTPTDTPRPTP